MSELRFNVPPTARSYGDGTSLIIKAGSRTLECGRASGPAPEQSSTGYDVSGESIIHLINKVIVGNPFSRRGGS